MASFTTLADLLLLLSTASGPRLTWYGAERIELSGPTAANWAIKTTNLIVEEFDAGPGLRVRIDLPVHWRTIVWALATWRAGATVVVAEGRRDDDATDEAGGGRANTEGRLADVDLLVTTRPEHAPSTAGDVIAVALPALARAYPGELPPGVTDAAAAVMTYGDQLGWVPETDPDALALDAAGPDDVHTLTYAELAAAPTGPAGRVLLDGRRGVAATLLATVATWRAGGSVVLLDEAFAAELDADPDRRRRLVETERIDE